MKKRLVVVSRLLLLFGSASVLAAWTEERAAQPPNSVQNTMYFRSQSADDPSCKPRFREGRVDWGSISNPAVTCPDAFGWVSLGLAIRQNFWTWATDQTIWPAKPKAICAPGQARPDCCDPRVMDKSTPHNSAPDPGCPYYPPDWTQAPALTTLTASLSHSHSFLKNLDPARILRQEEAEIVFRNRAFVKYSFEQNLYSKEGLGARFIAASNWTQANAPFRNRDLAISYPTDAVMFKADLISEKLMRENGLIQDLQDSDIPNNPENPYITFIIDADVGKSPKFKPGRYYLLAITAASKALPGWHWYAIEHVANPGRCDFNGCNDSFGFTALGRSPSGKELRQNYIAPHTQVAFTSTTPQGTTDEVIFELGKKYLPKDTGEKMTWELERLFREMGIGHGKHATSGKRPTHEDPAWKSYRLKGTQVDFVTNEGMEINVGASITEGGFVNSASCMTCHSQAGPNATGNPGLTGVGSQPRLNDFGYNQTVYGPPNLGWFYSYGTPNLIALQSDFAWGILNAVCVKPKTRNGKDTGNCMNYQVAAPKAVVENLGQPASIGSQPAD